VKRVILCGAQGVFTEGPRLAAHLGVPHVTLEAIRTEASAVLEPDKRLLLDGFPQTRDQVVRLILQSCPLRPCAVLVATIDEAARLEERVNRRWDPVGKEYYESPQLEGLDPEVQARLVQRPTDSKEAVRGKLEAHRALVATLKEAFGGLVHELEGLSDTASDLEALVLRAVPTLAATVEGTGAPLMVVGLPGSGKGRLCDWLQHRYSLQYMNSAQLVKDARATPGELGARVQAAMPEGSGSVPDAQLMVDICIAALHPKASHASPQPPSDAVTVGVVAEYLQSHPEWLLEGFPATAAQAALLCEAKPHADRVVMVADATLGPAPGGAAGQAHAESAAMRDSFRDAYLAVSHEVDLLQADKGDTAAVFTKVQQACS